jgi:hypothetical protein
MDDVQMFCTLCELCVRTLTFCVLCKPWKDHMSTTCPPHVRHMSTRKRIRDDSLY